MSILRRNITFNFFGQIFVALLGFISIKYIYSDLGEDALGIIYFSLILSTLFASALDMGLSKTTIREVAAHQQDNPDYINKLVQTFSLFYWSAYLIIVIGLIIFLPDIVGSWINLSTMTRDTAYFAILIISVSSLLSIPKMFLSSICVGLQRMDVNNGIDVAVAILQQLGMILFLMAGGDIITVSYWIAATNVLRIILYLFFISRLNSLKAIIPSFSMEVIRNIREYASKTFLASLILLVHKQLDKLIISKLMPIGVLGIYSLVFSTLSKTSLATEAVAKAVFPIFTDLEKRKEQENLFEKFFTLQDLLVFGTIPVYAFVIFMAYPLFTFLLDAAKAEILHITIYLLSISFYLNAALRLIRTYAFAVSKPEYVVKSDFLSLFIVTPLAVLLIFKMGMKGAAIAWIIFYALCAVYMVPRVYRRELHQSGLIWLASLLKAVVSACIAYIPMGLFVHKYYFGSTLSILTCYILSSLLYAVISINIIGENLQKVVLSYLPCVGPLIIARHNSG